VPIDLIAPVMLREVHVNSAVPPFHINTYIITMTDA